MSLSDALGIDYAIGELIMLKSFPIIVKRMHFKQMRDFFTRQMRTETFEQAFHKICSKLSRKYSHFDLIAHYLWFYKRDEYSWHLTDGRMAKHLSYSSLMTYKSDELRLNTPMQGIMKHINHLVFSDNIFKLIGDYLCVVCNF